MFVVLSTLGVDGRTNICGESLQPGAQAEAFNANMVDEALAQTDVEPVERCQ